MKCLRLTRGPGDCLTHTLQLPHACAQSCQGTGTCAKGECVRRYERFRQRRERLKERGRKGRKEREEDGGGGWKGEGARDNTRNNLELLYSNNYSHLQNSHHQRSLTYSLLVASTVISLSFFLHGASWQALHRPQGLCTCFAVSLEYHPHPYQEQTNLVLVFIPPPVWTIPGNCLRSKHVLVYACMAIFTSFHHSA